MTKQELLQRDIWMCKACKRHTCIEFCDEGTCIRYPMFDDKADWYKLEDEPWISVKDRLPEHIEKVLIYGGCYKAQEQTVFSGIFNSANNEWISMTNVLCNVTHWMPLPEPPQMMNNDGE